MTNKTPVSFRLDPKLVTLMAKVRTRDGVPAAQQVERALRLWFVQRGEIPNWKAKSTATRRPR